MKHLLLPLAEQALVNRLLSKKAPFTGGNKLGLGLVTLSCFLLFVALFFFILSGYGWLLTLYSQPLAALIVASSVIVASLIIGLSGYLCLKRKSKEPVQEQDLTKIISTVIDVIDEEWAAPIQENPKTAVLLAGLAGFVARENLHQ